MLTLLKVMIFAVLLFSVILHEVAHGYIALRLGDPTARDAGRLTLNPIKHIDPFGTVLLPLLLYFALLRDPDKDMMLVAASGPLTNITLAVLFGLGLRYLPAHSPPLFVDLLVYSCYINIILAFFNLLPIPPLDGSKLVAGFLPAKLKQSYLQLGRYSLFIILPFLYLALKYGVVTTIIERIFYLLVKA